MTLKYAKMKKPYPPPPLYLCPICLSLPTSQFTMAEQSPAQLDPNAILDRLDATISAEALEVPDLVEDAVKYVIFLVDANTLFDVALGMYDFALVLLIAQYAQKVCSIVN